MGQVRNLGVHHRSGVSGKIENLKFNEAGNKIS